MRIKRFPEMNPGKIIDVTKNYEPNKMVIDLAVADSRGRIPSSEIDEEEIRYVNKLSRLAI